MSEGGSQTSTTNSIPGWLQSAGQGYLQNAQNVAQQPYNPYTRQRVADLSPVQRQGIQGLSDLAGGTGSMNAAEDMLTGTLQGGYSNPFARQGVSGGGQYGFDPLSGGRNEYEGENPYFRQSLQEGLGDMADAYQRGTSADTTRLFNLSGAFGGSAHQSAIANNERGLARGMGSLTNSMRQGQFDRSGQLAESRLGRGQRAGEFNATLGNSAFENAARRGLDADQFNANLGSQGYENERNRQMQAVTGATGLAGQRGRAFTDAINAGDTERRSMQSLLDSQYGDFRDWRDYPERQLGIYGGALGNLLGRSGGSTTTQGPGGDRVGQGLGMWQLASQMGEKGGSGDAFSGSYGEGYGS